VDGSSLVTCDRGAVDADGGGVDVFVGHRVQCRLSPRLASRNVRSAAAVWRVSFASPDFATFSPLSAKPHTDDGGEDDDGGGGGGSNGDDDGGGGGGGGDYIADAHYFSFVPRVATAAYGNALTVRSTFEDQLFVRQIRAFDACDNTTLLTCRGGSGGGSRGANATRNDGNGGDGGSGGVVVGILMREPLRCRVHARHRGVCVRAARSAFTVVTTPHFDDATFTTPSSSASATSSSSSPTSTSSSSSSSSSSSVLSHTNIGRVGRVERVENDVGGDDCDVFEFTVTPAAYGMNGFTVSLDVFGAQSDAIVDSDTTAATTATATGAGDGDGDGNGDGNGVTGDVNGTRVSPRVKIAIVTPPKTDYMARARQKAYERDFRGGAALLTKAAKKQAGRRVEALMLRTELYVLLGFLTQAKATYRRLAKELALDDYGTAATAAAAAAAAPGDSMESKRKRKKAHEARERAKAASATWQTVRTKQRTLGRHCDCSCDVHLSSVHSTLAHASLTIKCNFTQ
jgi:hypothetical protein